MADIGLGSKEHYDLMDQFERAIRQSSIYGSQFDRENRELWPAGHVYKHGATNDLFLAYRMGYVCGKFYSDN